MPDNNPNPNGQPAAQDFDPTGGVFDEPQAPEPQNADATPATPAPPAATPEVPATPEPAKPAATIPPEQVIEILRQAGQLPAQQQPAPVQQPQAPVAPPTREQLEVQFEVFKPTQALVKKLLNLENPDDAVAAITEIRDGLTRQMLRIQQAMMQEALKPVAEQLNGLNEFKVKQEQYLAEQESSRFEENFYKEYPELTQLKPLVDAVTTKLGEVKGSAKDRMKTYAEAVKGTLSACNIALPTVSAAATPAAGRATTTRNGSGMATLTSGGHPGTRAATPAKKYEGPYAAANEVLDSQ